MNQLIISPFLISEFIILYSHFKLKFKYAQSFLTILIFLSIKILNKKMCVINIIFILGSIIIFTICYEKEKKIKETDGFRNKKSILSEFKNNKKVKKYESDLNSFVPKSKSKKMKEKFMNTGTHNKKKKTSYYKSFDNSPIYRKKYKSSIESFGKKMPFFIEKFKEIFE